MTPPKLTDEQIDNGAEQAVKAKKLSWLGYKKDGNGLYTVPELSPSHYQFAHDIADLVNQQWQEMLAKQPPVGSLSIRYFRGAKSMQNTDFDYYGDLPEGDYKLYNHPAPDHTAVMRQVYEVMGLMGADLICEAAHHAAKDRHESGEPCPIQKRWHEAFAALKQALGEK